MAEETTTIVEEEPSDGGEQQETPEQRLEQRLVGLEQRAFILGQELNGVKSVAQRAETITQKTTAAITALQEGLESRYAPKRAMALLEQAVRNTLGDDVWQTYERDGELDALKAQVQRKPEEKPLDDPQAAVVAELTREYNNTVLPARRKYWKSLGVTEVFAMAYQPSLRGIETDEDPRGWIGFAEEWDGKVARAKKTATAASTPKTPINTTRGSSAGNAVQERYQAWLKGDGPKPSNAEIDSLTAQYASM